MSVHVKNDDQYTELIEKQMSKGKAIFVKCSADWCRPCKMIAPYYDELAEANESNVFVSLDVEECEDTARELQIRGMPTFVVLKKGKEVSRIVGADKKKLVAVVNSFAE